MKTSLSLAGILMFCASMAGAQTTAMSPITGTVKTLSDGHVVVVTAGGEVSVRMTSKTRVFSQVKVSAPEIKTGSYLGTANVDSAAGGVATEVHLMDDGPNVANTPMPAPNTVMTNGHVKSVVSTPKGQEMEVDYGGSQTRHVVVPQNTPVSRMAPTTLAVGDAVTVRAATDGDGQMVAGFVLVAKPN